MGIKKFKPTTPGRRWMTVNTFEEITTSTPYKALTVKLKKSSGRNNTWRITVRHQWGGHAKRYRLVDFYSVDKKGIEARVETIEYDPYRSAFISLVCYKDWERRYVLAHKDVKVWDIIICDEKTPLINVNGVLNFYLLLKRSINLLFLVRKSVAIKVAEACLKFTGFFGLNFMKWATFVLEKMIKRYKKAFTPTLQTADKF